MNRLTTSRKVSKKGIIYLDRCSVLRSSCCPLPVGWTCRTSPLDRRLATVNVNVSLPPSLSQIPTTSSELSELSDPFLACKAKS